MATGNARLTRLWCSSLPHPAQVHTHRPPPTVPECCAVGRSFGGGQSGSPCSHHSVRPRWRPFDAGDVVEEFTRDGVEGCGINRDTHGFLLEGAVAVGVGTGTLHPEALAARFRPRLR